MKAYEAGDQLRCVVVGVREIPPHYSTTSRKWVAHGSVKSDDPKINGLYVHCYFPENSQLPTIGTWGIATKGVSGKWSFTPDQEAI
jgi:hypothetical protein